MLPKTNGRFEVEFQNQDARVLTVTENTNPAPPPAGFVALEPVSYVVALEGGSNGLTLQKIDYIRNANSSSSYLISYLPALESVLMQITNRHA